MVEVEYQIESELTNQNIIKEIAELYSNHYGFWGKTAKNPGKRIVLSENKIREWTSSEHAYIATARKNGELIGYVIAIVFFKNKQKKQNAISWITQLVVHEEYRQHGIAKKLIFSFWGFSNHYAWGIMSSNPYAIRALEKATYRRVDPLYLKSNKATIVNFGKEYVSYVHEDTEFVIEEDVCKVNTEFPSDISKVEEKLVNVTRCGVPWYIGKITEGWEWLAFTFNGQEKITLSKDDISSMLDVSDEVAREAYSRMLMNDSSHKWAQHTKKEVEYIKNLCSIDEHSTIADFGCGIGRHIGELLKEGFSQSVGIDYSEDLISIAKRNNQAYQTNFLVGDCRSIDLGQEYDLIVSLYDVIGSFIDNSENIRILKNIYKHLKQGGSAIISVMNMELTKHIAKNKFDFESEYNQLLKLPSSDTMEKTGDVFNPQYFMLDEKSNIVYRREQFTSGEKLHQELIVRDYRFDRVHIENMCKEVGFHIKCSRYVQAGKWNIELDATDSRAKEILLCLEKL
jgi:2-polyprenyl-3-methyl-5-hydroxy-6-metoxy-1,4-benzoquinol methylase/ribosomal protein S18 acetylase RimI-like enzyme